MNCARSMFKYASKLREAAVNEVATVRSKVLPKEYLNFDQDHKATPRTNEGAAADEFDANNWVARYSGPNVEHIGNGSGGPR